MSSIDILRNKLIDQFGSMYALNDSAHREPHFENVYRCARHINNVSGAGYSLEILMLGAYLHDLFSYHRDVHHELAATFVAKSSFKPLLELTPEERHALAAVVGEHRSSYRGDYTSRLSEVLAAADRGFPNVVAKIERAIQSRKDLYPTRSATWHRENAIATMKRKFGTDGTARFPSVYEEVFGDQYHAMRAAFDAL